MFLAGYPHADFTIATGISSEMGVLGEDCRARAVCVTQEWKAARWAAVDPWEAVRWVVRLAVDLWEAVRWVVEQAYLSEAGEVCW